MAEKSAETVRPATPTQGGGSIPLAYLFLILTALFWAGTAIAGRISAGQVPPMALSFWRWAGALAIFLIIGAPKLPLYWRMFRAQWKILAVFAFFGVFLFSTLYLIGVQLTTATTVTLLNSTGPVLILLCAFAISRSPISGRQWLGILLATSGASAIVLKGDFSTLLGLRFNAGDLLVLGAFLSWAIYTAILKWRPVGLDQTGFLIAITALGLLMIAPLYAWELATIGGFTPTASALGVMIYLSAFPSVAGYYLWNKGISTLGASRGSFAQYLIPVFGVGLAVGLLGEEIRAYHFVGIALVLGGVYLATTKTAKRRTV